MNESRDIKNDKNTPDPIKPQRVMDICNELTDRGFLTRLDEIYPDSEQEKDKRLNYLKILKANKPIIEKKKVNGNVYYNFIRDEDSQNVKSYLVYILASEKHLEVGKTPKDLIEEEIEKTYLRFSGEDKKKDTIISGIEKLRLEQRAELEEFNNQRLIAKGFSIIKSFGNDIINFMGEMFHRECPKCHSKIILANNPNIDDPDYDPDLKVEPIKVSSKRIYDDFKEIQRLYLMPYEEALKTKEHPLSKMAMKQKESKKLWKRSLNQLKNRLVCNKCKAGLIKQRLLMIDSVVYSWGWGIESGKNSILFGFPENTEHLCIRE